MSDFGPSGQAGNGLDPTKRVNYQLGLVLGVNEFLTEQHYFRERDHRATRALHGYGTVAGLAVTFDGSQLRVAPGLAVDPAGRLVCVPEEYCADLDAWLTDKLDEVAEPDPSIPGPVTLYVVLCHAECETDEVPVPSESCLTAEESRAASRIRDSFELKIVTEPPAEVGEVAPGSLTSLAETVDAIWGELDPSGGSPPDYAAAAEAIRAWVVEHRPEVAAGNACLGPDDECVLLARVDVDVDPASGGGLSGSNVDVDDSERPILVSTRFLQEALARVAPADHEHGLDELTDVGSAAATNGQILAWNDGALEWQPRDFTHNHPHGHPHQHDLGDLGDVNTAGVSDGPADGDVLTFDEDAAAWVPSAPTSGGGAHGDLSGLGADNHPQYLRTDGSRSLTGPWNAGNRIQGLPTSSANGEPITHGRNAGGDLSGSYPSPRIQAIQASPVDAAAPQEPQALLFAGGRWTAAAPRLLPLATVERVDNASYMVWLHLDVVDNRVEVEDLEAGFELFDETDNDPFLDPLGFNMSPLTRNVFFFETETERDLLRCVFRLPALTVLPDGMPLDEWARNELIWFLGQDPASESVTAFALNASALFIRNFGERPGDGTRFEPDDPRLDDGRGGVLRQPTRRGRQPEPR